MDQPTAKRILNELIKRDDLENKKCIDCGNPNPQWASVSFAIFICLQCAGHHRSYGVHISFVRSVSMDTWSEDQIKRMQLGGNKPFKDFMKSYPGEQGGYTVGMEPHETYHSWAASQYRSKLDADLTGAAWSPSPPPANASSPSGHPVSAQALRKSRSGRSATDTISRSNSGSPASFSATSTPVDQKSRNEAFFESLGNTNASRSEHLPPSQGGKYQGFGNTPSPAPGSSSPAFGLSSRAAPSLTDFQEDPMAAFSKGWSLFSSVVASATQAVNENVIQPGMERVMDPEFQANVRGYATEAGKRATQVGAAANEWGRTQFGVDVGSQVSGVMGSMGRDRTGYGALSQEAHGSNGRYNDSDPEDDFFGQFEGSSSSSQQQQTSATRAAPAPVTAAPVQAAKKDDDWDDWKDF